MYFVVWCLVLQCPPFFRPVQTPKLHWFLFNIDACPMSWETHTRYYHYFLIFRSKKCKNEVCFPPPNGNKDANTHVSRYFALLLGTHFLIGALELRFKHFKHFSEFLFHHFSLWHCATTGSGCTCLHLSFPLNLGMGTNYPLRKFRMQYGWRDKPFSVSLYGRFWYFWDPWCLPFVSTHNLKWNLSFRWFVSSVFIIHFFHEHQSLFLCCDESAEAPFIFYWCSCKVLSSKK